MSILSIVLLIFCIIFLLAFLLVLFLLTSLIKKYRILENIFNFYDELLNKIVTITTSIDDDATRVLNTSFIDGNQDIKRIFMEVKKLRDTYRMITKEYNNKNIYGNKVIIEELND
jgi:predicted PurR-regulated permease PerM